MSGWALDLGTTNTGLSRWDLDADRAEFIQLPSICRRPGRNEALEAPRLIPSATHMLPPEGFFSKLGRTRFFLPRVFWGKHAAIGREALDLNEGWQHPNFAHSFKRYLAHAPNRTIARTRGRNHSAREVARTFLRELLRNVDEATGTRIRDLVVTVPVESYDQYRAELSRMGRSLGIKNMRFLDEPVAAAIGYGLGLRASRRVLVVDFGGGTLDLAVVEIIPREAEKGGCKVIAKAGRPVGGNLVDEWLLEHFAKQMEVVLDRESVDTESELWYRLLLSETQRVKESVYFSETATFEMSVPVEFRNIGARIRGRSPNLEVSRSDIIDTLRTEGLYDILEDCADGISEQMAALGMSESDIDDVLMVGGSTLLPNVYGVFEARYGRDRVRAWKPFEAVAFGASAYSAGQFGQSDFVVHDYAFVTYDSKSHEKEFVTIVPHGTRFPQQNIWQKKLVPTCALGEPEKYFKLVVCEIAVADGERRFTWDADGNLHQVKEGETIAPVIVPLNESNPTLGELSPPHMPGDRTPRLEIGFGVNESRWLTANVKDLKTGKLLMKNEPVVRVL